MAEALGETGPHILGPAQAPTPFTADEIRTGCPVGRTSRLRVDQPGLPPTYRIHRFVRCDSDGADIARGEIEADGTPIGPVKVENRTAAGDLTRTVTMVANHLP